MNRNKEKEKERDRETDGRRDEEKKTCKENKKDGWREGGREKYIYLVVISKERERESGSVREKSRECVSVGSVR